MDADAKAGIKALTLRKEKLVAQMNAINLSLAMLGAGGGVVASITGNTGKGNTGALTPRQIAMANMSPEARAQRSAKLKAYWKKRKAEEAKEKAAKVKVKKAPAKKKVAPKAEAPSGSLQDAIL